MRMLSKCRLNWVIRGKGSSRVYTDQIHACLFAIAIAFAVAQLLENSYILPITCPQYDVLQAQQPRLS